MRGIRRIGVLAALVALALVLVACSGTSGQSGGTTGGTSSGTSSGTTGGTTITLQNLAFNPTSLTVKVGDTVTIKNEDTAPHHIVVGTDDLGEQAQGATVTWKAPKDGVYMMKCLIHPSMQGQITVGAGGSTVGTAPAGGTGGTAPGY